MADLVALPAVQAPRLDLSVAPFDGQKRNFRTLLRSLCLLYMANPTTYAMDLVKVLFALSKITGEGFAVERANMKAIRLGLTITQLNRKVDDDNTNIRGKGYK